MSRILIVEDEISIAELEKDYLELSDYEVDIASDGETGESMALKGDYVLCILDVMLPGKDGFEICKAIRKEKNIPIIMVSAKRDDIDKIRGLGLGADDYITKPFSPKVLVAKVKALLKRTSEKVDSSTQDFNGLVINKLSREVKIDENILSLSPKEYELLIYLTSNEGIALSRDNILDNVWGIDYYGDIRTVDTNVKRLREKLGDKANYIVTVRGSGYKFEVK